MCVTTSTFPPALVNPGVAFTSSTARKVLRAVIVPYAVCPLPATPLIAAVTENWNTVPEVGVIETEGLLRALLTGIDCPGPKVTLVWLSDPLTPPGSVPRLSV
jgi:hypothetical protein